MKYLIDKFIEDNSNLSTLSFLKKFNSFSSDNNIDFNNNEYYYLFNNARIINIFETIDKDLLMDNINRLEYVKIFYKKYNEYKELNEDNDTLCFKLIDKKKKELINDKSNKTIEEEIHLLKQKIILNNLDFVIMIAKRYSSLAPLDDLIQEGNIGLIKAVDKYDYTKGILFKKFASIYIKGHMIDYLNELSIIKKPYRKIRELKRVQEKLRINLKREPTIDEIADEMNISTNHVLSILNHDNYIYTIDNNEMGIENLKIINHIIVNEKSVLDDMIERVDYNNLIRALYSIDIDETSKLMILLNYGFINDISYNHETIAKMFNIKSSYSTTVVAFKKKNAFDKIKKIYENGIDNGIYILIPRTSVIPNINEELEGKNVPSVELIKNDKLVFDGKELLKKYNKMNDMEKEKLIKGKDLLTNFKKYLNINKYYVVTYEELNNDFSFSAYTISKLQHSNVLKRIKKDTYIFSNLDK